MPISEPPKTNTSVEFPVVPVSEAQKTTGFGELPVNGGAHQQHNSNNPFDSPGVL